VNQISGGTLRPHFSSGLHLLGQFRTPPVKRASRVSPDIPFGFRVQSFSPKSVYRWGRMPSYRPRRASAQPDRGVVRDQTMSQPISGGLRRRGLCDYRFQSVATLVRIPLRVKRFLSPFFVAGQKAHSECVVRIRFGADIPREAAWSVKAAFLRHAGQSNAAELGALRCNSRKSMAETPWAAQNRYKFDIYPRTT
jgi:hypothetical protein